MEKNALSWWKNGTTTGITVGRTTGIESFVRQYAGKDFTIHSTSMEIAVHSYSPKDKAFSVPGDSGSSGKYPFTRLLVYFLKK